MTTIASDPRPVDLQSLDGLPSLAAVAFSFFSLDGDYTANAWSWVLDEARGALAKKRLTIETDLWRGRLGAVLDTLDTHLECPRLELRLRQTAKQPVELWLDVTRRPRGYHVAMRGTVYWPNSVFTVFQDLVRTDVDIEVTPPQKKVELPVPEPIGELASRLGDRLRVLD